MPVYPKGTKFLYFSSAVVSMQKTDLAPGKTVLVEENFGIYKEKNRVPTEKLRPAPPRHPRFSEIKCVTGYVDSYGAVHAVIIFDDQDTQHEAVFPEVTRHKRWRWWRSEGLDKSALNQVEPDSEDWENIKSWLLKNGCFNYWEVD